MQKKEGRSRQRFCLSLPAREATYSCGKVPFSGILFDLTVASLRNSGYNLDEVTKAAFSKFKDNFGVKSRCFRL
jgi:hypothetical protein